MSMQKHIQITEFCSLHCLNITPFWWANYLAWGYFFCVFPALTAHCSWFSKTTTLFKVLKTSSTKCLVSNLLANDLTKKSLKKSTVCICIRGDENCKHDHLGLFVLFCLYWKYSPSSPLHFKHQRRGKKNPNPTNTLLSRYQQVREVSFWSKPA